MYLALAMIFINLFSGQPKVTHGSSDFVKSPSIQSQNKNTIYGKYRPSLCDNAALSDAKALPLEWLLDPAKGDSVSERVLARLVQSQAHEVNPHLQADYRQSWITVYYASLGNPIPFVEASYRIHGCHPDKLWPQIVANRKAMLGPDYDKWFDADGNLRPDKKPSQSIGKDKQERAA